jgi:RNA recognition motif-containing protein
MMKPRKYATGLVGDDGPDEGGSSSNPIPGPSHGRGFSIPKKPFGRGAPSTTDYKPKQGNTVHVKAKGITEEKCREAFQNIGSILNISMELERNCGFVTFSTVASAEKAIQEVRTHI